MLWRCFNHPTLLATRRRALTHRSAMRFQSLHSPENQLFLDTLADSALGFGTLAEELLEDPSSAIQREPEAATAEKLPTPESPAHAAVDLETPLGTAPGQATDRREDHTSSAWWRQRG